mmetsp:Transcript_28901/g.65366  ORF Transcript_28901/g.65366 Transcript_28901/m.65366 type:complete len:218 (-) Transcript_28901:8-661(-)
MPLPFHKLFEGDPFIVISICPQKLQLGMALEDTSFFRGSGWMQREGGLEYAVALLEFLWADCPVAISVVHLEEWLQNFRQLEELDAAIIGMHGASRPREPLCKLVVLDPAIAVLVGLLHQEVHVMPSQGLALWKQADNHGDKFGLRDVAVPVLVPLLEAVSDPIRTLLGVHLGALLRHGIHRLPRPPRLSPGLPPLRLGGAGFGAVPEMHTLPGADP